MDQLSAFVENDHVSGVYEVIEERRGVSHGCARAGQRALQP